MTKRRVCDHTKSGRPITDAAVDKLAAEAEAGYDPEQLIASRNKRGRPTIGNAPSSVESVRLDPELGVNCSSEQKRTEPRPPS